MSGVNVICLYKRESKGRKPPTIYISLNSKEKKGCFCLKLGGIHGVSKVFRFHGFSRGVNARQDRLLKEVDSARFNVLLDECDRLGLEANFVDMFLGKFADKAFKGAFPDQKLRPLLIFSDVSKSDSAGMPAMGFFHDAAATGSNGLFLGSWSLHRRHVKRFAASAAVFGGVVDFVFCASHFLTSVSLFTSRVAGGVCRFFLTRLCE